MPQRILVFDVNGTLLDLVGLDALFQSAFGGADARAEWFEQLLKSSMVWTMSGRYRDFTALGRAALQLLAARRGIALADDQEERIVGRVRQLPPYADAKPALTRLKAAGFRMAALTNSAPAVASAQLEHAGLAAYFEQILSVDEVKRFKPAPEPYTMAARRLGAAVTDLRMVAAHGWDVFGAMAAGCAGAFVARGGAAFDPLAPPPDITEPTLDAIADAIVQVDG
jgi:2-haloacid dehalogenase